MSAKFTRITSGAQLDALFAESFVKPVALVKHSNSCGISADVLHKLGEVDGDIAVIVIQENRDLSNSMADRIRHRHQSPQAFVIKDGKAIYHATHYGISPETIQAKLTSDDQ